MIWIKAYVGTLIAFLALDSLWLGVLARDLYPREIGHLMSDELNGVAVVLFYAVYVTGIVFIAVRPALAATDWRAALINGAALGFVAYATYDLTNWATLENWSATVVSADLLWGTFVTGAAAIAGYAAARRSA